MKGSRQGPRLCFNIEKLILARQNESGYMSITQYGQNDIIKLLEKMKQCQMAEFPGQITWLDIEI